MIFADKLIRLRRKSGWSQEELAEQMNVSRQSVSKWEGAQSVPDLEKIVRLSELFGVSTDYLLKDQIEEPEVLASAEDTPLLRRVSMEEANAFLTVKTETSRPIAYASFLCILSPICLLILGAISETPGYALSENAAGGVGMIVMLIFIAAAAAIFISSGSKTARFEYLEKEVFETEYGVRGMVSERKEQYKSTYTRNNILGTCLCTTSLLPLFCGVIFNEDDDLLLVCMLCITLILVGIGVIFFICGGIIWASYEKLLQENDYSKAKKESRRTTTALAVVYWSITAAIYLACSLPSEEWERSWIVWVIAGVLFPAVIRIFDAFSARRH